MLESAIRTLHMHFFAQGIFETIGLETNFVIIRVYTISKQVILHCLYIYRTVL